MAVSLRPGDLRAALDLIAQPLVLEALVAAGDGRELEAPPSDIHAVAISLAMQRLTAIGAIRASRFGPSEFHSLTPRGIRLLEILEDLDSAIEVD